MGSFKVTRKDLLTQWHKVVTVTQHHIHGQLSLIRAQMSPLVQRKDHSHISKFPRLPYPLDSSQVQPVIMVLVRIYWPTEERKKLASFFIGLSASASYSWMWLSLFHGSSSYRRPFLSVVPAPTDCPTMSPAAKERGTLAPDSSNTSSSPLTP